MTNFLGILTFSQENVFTKTLLKVQFFLPGGAFEGVGDHITPFGYKSGEGVHAGLGEPDWICSRDRARTDPLFEALNPVDGKISGACKFLLNLFFKFHQKIIFFIYFHIQNSGQTRVDKIEITKFCVEQNLEVVGRRL